MTRIVTKHDNNLQKGVPMHELVLIKNDEEVTTSLKVAESFGKRHNNVIQAIENLMGGLLKIEDTQQMFKKGRYRHEQNGQYYPMYYMNRDGFSLLVMGFTGNKAMEWKLKYIAAFNEMEKELKARKDSRISQRTAMDILAESNAGHVDYIKANTISNKAVSNLYGYKKMIKKADMSEEMLKDRDSILSETANLMAVSSKFGLNLSISDLIYEKFGAKEVKAYA